MKTRPIRFISVLMALSLILLQSCGSESKETSPTKPSVILISLDTLRADALGCYGYDRDTSPVLDAFAKEAVLFEQAIVQSNSTPTSHAAMLTGMDPIHLRLGARNIVDAEAPNDGPNAMSYGYGLLDDFTPTLTKLLSLADYTTGGFTAHEGWLGPKNGFDLNFDHFETGYPTASVNRERVTSWLQEAEMRPLFLFIHDYDVHSDTKRLPYEVPPPFFGTYSSWYKGDFDGSNAEGVVASELLVSMHQGQRQFDQDTITYIRDLYDEGVQFTDHEMGLLFDQLKEHDLWDSSIIIVTSDHGEEFQEHGGLLHYQLYDEVLRVPLMIRFPESLWAGTRVSSQVRCVDITPTVLDFLGMDPSPTAIGESLIGTIKKTIEGLQPDDTGAGSFSCGDHSATIRTRAFKYHAWWDKQEKYFDLLQDPFEQNDILSQNPPSLESQQFELTTRFNEYQRQGEKLAKLRHSAGRGTQSFSDEEREYLKRLGYILGKNPNEEKPEPQIQKSEQGKDVR